MLVPATPQQAPGGQFWGVHGSGGGQSHRQEDMSCAIMPPGQAGPQEVFGGQCPQGGHRHGPGHYGDRHCQAAHLYLLSARMPCQPQGNPLWPQLCC